jgi:response regulator RpfG family c-di-GMP phosphodiesterase
MYEIYSGWQRGLFGDSPADDMTKHSPTILYIDDESDQRIFLGALLEYRGFRVRTARRALDASNRL